jgi:DNA repair protein RecN (Recombination protein N)
VRPEELPAKAAELARRFGELELAVNPEALRKEVAAAQDRYESVSRKLSAKRRAGAEALGKAVTAAMQKLAMAGGRFAVKLNSLEQPAQKKSNSRFPRTRACRFGRWRKWPRAASSRA